MEKDSISVVAKQKSRDEVFLSMPLQTQWFAVSLYGVFANFNETASYRSDTWSVEFEGQQHTLNWRADPNCFKLET